MREVDAARAVNGSLTSVFWPNQIARFLDRPRLSAVETARLVLVLLFLGIARVAHRHHFEMRGAEAHHNFIAPAPDAVIRRPSAETPFFLVYDGVRHARVLLRQAECSEHKAGESQVCSHRLSIKTAASLLSGQTARV